MAHAHAVEFYESDPALTSCLYDFMAPALRSGKPAVVVATPEHRRLFAQAFAQSGVDLAKAERKSLYVALDAEETMSGFMSGQLPDPVRFFGTVGKLVRTTRGGFGNIHLYGEMVSILWSEGNRAGALALEELWNDLAGHQPFELLCAYPTSFFELGIGSAEFWHICERHTDSHVTVGGRREDALKAVPRVDNRRLPVFTPPFLPDPTRRRSG